jgi:hypothetical protein
VRLFNSTLYSTVALSLLAGCSSNMATTPSAGLAGAALSRPDAINRSVNGRSKQDASAEVVALQTSNGDYVTAAGLPIAEPNCGSGQVALHDDATKIGPEEKFTMVNEGNNIYAFRLFRTRYYISAVNGGGMGGPDQSYGYSQLHTDSTSGRSWEMFKIIPVGRYVALETAWNTYVTAIADCGGTNTVPFHTNARKVGPWEKFTLVSE